MALLKPYPSAEHIRAHDLEDATGNQSAVQLKVGSAGSNNFIYPDFDASSLPDTSSAPAGVLRGVVEGADGKEYLLRSWGNSQVGGVESISHDGTANTRIWGIAVLGIGATSVSATGWPAIMEDTYNVKITASAARDEAGTVGGASNTDSSGVYTGVRVPPEMDATQFVIRRPNQPPYHTVSGSVAVWWEISGVTLV